ncbi:MAG: ECF transporter S component, partial [Odoribacteraceae bacterium]|nr:ECF transporter S component [Odoribacteraceae bacterium]
METTVKLHSLSYSDAKTYLFALLFVAGNLLLPRACHIVPDGGLMLLPIFFFTLVGAYKYGLHVGLLTAILSPLLNNLLFAMPPAGMLPLVLV